MMQIITNNKINDIKSKISKLNIKQIDVFDYLKTLDNNTDCIEKTGALIIINHTLKEGVVVAWDDKYSGFYHYVDYYMWALHHIVNDYKYKINNIFAEDSFSLYKDLPTDDLYKIVFKKEKSYGDCSRKGILTEFFSPSDVVIEKIDTFKKKYNIIPEKCVGVYYRGTDKSCEVTLPNPLLFLEKTKSLECEQILLQTDQQQVVDLFVNYFKEKCIIIFELPTSNTNKSVHHNQKDHKVKTAIELNSVLRIISECKEIILNPNSAVSRYIMRLNEPTSHNKIHNIT